MKYYIFETLNEEGNVSGYGYVPEDAIAEENLESVKNNAFAVLDKLPEIDTSITGEYKLNYNEEEDVFFWAAV